ncbi:ROK family protein [Glaciibacter psychrotolerans]|uniref:Glucokinase n=1 Tax=Glaciibacter psychrotolerans TaxID=670054 RepID=A0A7Z0J718_9MICO|nr:ROK family protein [Leifsonia psychrotolerans]NYJ20498.1 glucokinase [Leifsonia psychrotolerans]
MNPVKRTHDSVLAVDIGGTWTRAAAVTEAGDIVASARAATVSTGSIEEVRSVWRSVLAECEEALAGIGHSAAFKGVGVGVTGPVDRETGVTFVPPNTGNALANVELGAEFTTLTGLRTVVERDTNAAALAEQRYGAARGSSSFVYLTISTGVGGAIIDNDRLLLGHNGAAGELGHVVVSPNGPMCGCGRRGCIEAIASGPALASAALSGAADPSATGLAALISENGGHLTGLDVDRAAHGGDPLAIAILARAKSAVSSWATDVTNIFNPELIVIGGSVAAAHPDWIVEAASAIQQNALMPSGSTAKVVAASLGDDGVLLGAALAAWSQVRAENS